MYCWVTVRAAFAGWDSHGAIGPPRASKYPFLVPSRAAQVCKTSCQYTDVEEK